jgi:hypothetical protein
MTDRARLSRLPSYTPSNGTSFLGSTSFPPALITSIQKSDPKGLLFGTSSPSLPTSPSLPPSHIKQILDTKIKNKRILVCSGGEDKLVPYHCSEPFLKFLKNAVGKGGWYEGEVYVEDNVYEGVGHAFSEGMVRHSVRFVGDTLAGAESRVASKL